MDLVDAAKNLSLTQLSASITHVSLHSAYPGTTGTSEISGGSPAYARRPVTWGTASGGSVAATAGLDFNVPASTTVGWAGLWSASTSGTFYGSVPLGPVGDPRLTMAATSNTFTAISHGWSNGQAVSISKTLGALPGGITGGGIYFVRDVSGNNFSVAATAGGAAVNISAAGTGLIRAVTTETFGGQGTYTITSLTLNLA